MQGIQMEIYALHGKIPSSNQNIEVVDLLFINIYFNNDHTTILAHCTSMVILHHVQPWLT